jgi:probable rRNA maturation factor
MQVNFHHSYKKLKYPKKLLSDTAEEIFKKEKVSRSQTIDVVLCSDHYIKKLNSDYRNIEKVTDVLSFSFNDPDFLGEIYISLQRAKVQSEEYGNSYDQEILRLFIHGMFHLLGYDHETESEGRMMRRKESRYIK